MKDEVFKLIRTDKVLRRKIADALGIEPDSVYRQAVNKADNLKKPLVVEFIAKQLGKKVKDIIE